MATPERRREGSTGLLRIEEGQPRAAPIETNKIKLGFWAREDLHGHDQIMVKY